MKNICTTLSGHIGNINTTHFCSTMTTSLTGRLEAEAFPLTSTVALVDFSPCGFFTVSV